MLFLFVLSSCVLISDEDFEKRLESFGEGCFYGDLTPPNGALDYGLTQEDIGPEEERKGFTC